MLLLEKAGLEMQKLKEREISTYIEFRRPMILKCGGHLVVPVESVQKSNGSFSYKVKNPC